jgi:hypothetical protein
MKAGAARGRSNRSGYISLFPATGTSAIGNIHIAFTAGQVSTPQ